MAISANIYADTYFGRVPFKVSFNAVNLLYDEDIVGFLWQFGDGETSTLRNPTHTYRSYGVHTVALTVIGASGNSHVEIEPELIKGLKIDFRAEITKKSDRYTVQFINESEIPSGYLADSWDWDFGDNTVNSNDFSPIHDYTSRGYFSVTQKVVISGPGDFTETYINSKSKSVVRDPIRYNTCNKFLCMGWIRRPQFSVSGNPLYPFVVSDPQSIVLDTEDSIKFSILKDGNDYRLEFKGAKTKAINKTKKIDFSDDNWHSLVFMCVSNDGTMRFLVDGIEIPVEDGFGPDGFLYSIAHGETSRPGGGNLWAPYLYESGQGIQLYNWRFKAGLNISDEWVGQLLEIDKRSLGIDG